MKLSAATNGILDTIDLTPRWRKAESNGVAVKTLPPKQQEIWDAAVRIRERGDYLKSSAIAVELGHENTYQERTRINSNVQAIKKTRHWPPIESNGRYKPEASEISPQPCRTKDHRRDPEIVAMEAIVETLDGLPEMARRRVLLWLRDRAAQEVG